MRGICALALVIGGIGVGQAQWSVSDLFFAIRQRDSTLGTQIRFATSREGVVVQPSGTNRLFVGRHKGVSNGVLCEVQIKGNEAVIDATMTERGGQIREGSALHMLSAVSGESECLARLLLDQSGEPTGAIALSVSHLASGSLVRLKGGRAPVTSWEIANSSWEEASEIRLQEFFAFMERLQNADSVESLGAAGAITLSADGQKRYWPRPLGSRECTVLEAAEAMARLKENKLLETFLSQPSELVAPAWKDVVSASVLSKSAWRGWTRVRPTLFMLEHTESGTC